MVQDEAPRGKPAVDAAVVVREVLPGYTPPVRGLHGVVHWARVLENGLRLAEITGADLEVVTLFALFHDARRRNEDHDPGHGQRGAELARSLRGSLIHLSDAGFELLHHACSRHTAGMTAGDVTVQTCWDADRLDLGRVGVVPHPPLLCTDAARRLIGWAHVRAVNGYEPEFVSKAWGF